MTVYVTFPNFHWLLQGGGALQGHKNNMIGVKYFWRFEIILSVVLFCSVVL